MFGLFRKKSSLLGYSRHSSKSISDKFEEHGIVPPLGIDAYCTGQVIVEKENMWVDVLASKLELTENDEIYDESLMLSTYIEPYGGEVSNSKSGYIRTKNVPHDLFKEWVDKSKIIQEKLKSEKVGK